LNVEEVAVAVVRILLMLKFGGALALEFNEGRKR
jgi:hypothetical protein